MYNNLPIAILEEVALATVDRGPEVEIPGVGVVVAAKYKGWYWGNVHNNLPITILEEVAPEIVGLDVEIPGASCG